MDKRMICATCAHCDGGKCVSPDSCFDGCRMRPDCFCTEWAERHDRCDGCRHYLGGGCCRLNVEKECAAGGFELWEGETEKEGAAIAATSRAQF